MITKKTKAQVSCARRLMANWDKLSTQADNSLWMGHLSHKRVVREKQAAKAEATLNAYLLKHGEEFYNEVAGDLCLSWPEFVEHVGEVA